MNGATRELLEGATRAKRERERERRERGCLPPPRASAAFFSASGALAAAGEHLSTPASSAPIGHALRGIAQCTRASQDRARARAERAGLWALTRAPSRPKMSAMSISKTLRPELFGNIFKINSARASISLHVCIVLLLLRG